MSPERISHDQQSSPDHFDFLAASGELASLIRQKDWSETSLGPVEHWPQRLKHALALCLDSRFATYVWWGDECTTLYNDAAIPHLRSRHPAALGKPARQIWAKAWSELEPLMAKALGGEGVFAENFELKPEPDDESGSAYFTFCYAPLRIGDGEIAGLFAISLETTHVVQSEAALRAGEQRLQAIVDSAKEYAIITFDEKGCITSWNPGAERLLGYSEEEAIGRSGEIFFTPEDREAGKPELEMTLTREQGRSVDERWHLRKDGSIFWGSGLMLPMEGHPRDRYLKIFRDNTAERHLQERQRLLTHELNHRVKNLLTIVQSVAMQTLRQSGCSEDIRAALESRLVALARAQDVLNAGDWRGGDLREIIEATLRLIVYEGFESRVNLQGPEVHLDSGALLGLSLAFHELATNAVKYGALSNDSGNVEIEWGTSDDADPQFRLRWIERGGPPVQAPARRGFGSRVIEEGLAHEFDGRVELKFAREGLECTIQAPLREITGERT
ncbi:MAG TPA: HWE histidine kinase domain-containing protein [Rhodanobacteraceae bacterium]|nr:HWE histidine kinase domain-containing protein [Rhodanobacteraceae bacterium]